MNGSNAGALAMAKVLKGILGVVLMATAFIPGLNVLSLGAKALLAVGMAGVSMTLSFAAEKLFGPKYHVPNYHASIYLWTRQHRERRFSAQPP